MNGDWGYDINTRYSAKAKIEAASISKYATESPYETFAEGFLAKEKGEKIPDSIAKVIGKAERKAGVKRLRTGSGVMEMNLQFFAKVPDEKLTEYALNMEHPTGKYKAEAFKKALGYTQENYADLKAKILDSFDENELVYKREDKYGKRYEQIMQITGPNGKTANVLTAWIKDDDNVEPRLTSIYVDKR